MFKDASRYVYVNSNHVNSRSELMWFAQDVLVFTCLTCGYQRSEPTKDAPLGPPPAPDASRDTGMQLHNSPSWLRRIFGY